MKLETYINFSGNCAEAMQYYQTHLGAKLEMMMTHAQSPEPSQLDPQWQNAVLHARLTLGGSALLAADIPNAQPMRSAYLTLATDSDEEAERIYSALSDGGRIFVSIREMFFATRFAQVQDRFGMNWMILHERPMPAGQP